MRHKKLTKQEYYDLLVKEIKEPAVSVENRYLCAYRGLNGSKCAIGLLIPDSLYKDSFERKSVADLPKTLVKTICPEGMSVDDLKEIQKCHDINTNKNNTRIKFRHCFIHSLNLCPCFLNVHRVHKAPQ